jgi:hypothetical protein
MKQVISIATIMLVSFCACNIIGSTPKSPKLVSPKNGGLVTLDYGDSVWLVFEPDENIESALAEISESSEFEPWDTREAGWPRFGGFGTSDSAHPNSFYFCAYTFGKTYYWRAYVCDSSGNWSKASDVWSFSVEEL